MEKREENDGCDQCNLENVINKTLAIRVCVAIIILCSDSRDAAFQCQQSIQQQRNHISRDAWISHLIALSAGSMDEAPTDQIKSRS